MKHDGKTLIERSSAFVWLGLATVAFLLVPFLAMQFTPQVRWDETDFLVMGFLLYGSGSLFVLLARHLQRRYWLATAIVIALLFVYVWAELAVGIFTNLGS